MAEVPVILLVEDNAGDIDLFQRAAQRANLAWQVHAVRTGEQAVDFLRRVGEHVAAPRPDLVILDLNLPGMMGAEVLRTIKNTAEWCDIPVVVFTSSGTAQDIKTSYQNHASSYMVKPVAFNQLMRFVRAIDEWWFQLGSLPSN